MKSINLNFISTFSGKVDLHQLEELYTAVRSKFIHDTDIVELLSSHWMVCIHCCYLLTHRKYI